MSEELYQVTINTIRELSADLVASKQQSAADKEEQRRYIDAQMTALRQDFYGSILYLEQSFVSFRKTESEERIVGQRKARNIWTAVLGILLLILLAVLWLIFGGH